MNYNKLYLFYIILSDLILRSYVKYSKYYISSISLLFYITLGNLLLEDLHGTGHERLIIATNQIAQLSLS